MRQDARSYDERGMPDPRFTLNAREKNGERIDWHKKSGFFSPRCRDEYKRMGVLVG